MSNALHKRPRLSQPDRSLLRGGFSFVEILFALTILGIGFIMIAGIFPVAIRQTQLTYDETTGRAVALEAMKSIDGAIVAYTDLPVTTAPLTVMPVTDSILTPTPDRIVAADPRFAWVAYYSRSATATAIDVWAIALRVRNVSQYPLNYSNGTYPPGSYPPQPVPVQVPALTPASVVPAAVMVDISTDPDSPGRVTLNASSANYAEALQAMAEGTYVVASIGTTVNVYRLGNALNQAGGMWQLSPDSPTTVTPLTTAANVPAYIVGRGLRDPTLSWDINNNPHEGLAQDITVYHAQISRP